MRAFLPALLTIVLITTSIDRSAAQFDIGDNIVGLGLGIGGNYGSSTSQSPALGFSYERGVTDLGPGILGIGGFLGYKTTSYSSRYYPYNFNYDWRNTYLILGIRGVWHYNEWHGNDRLDTYGGLMLSYNSVSWTDRTNYPDGSVAATSGSASSGLGLTAFVGTRYYFNDNFAAFGELGYGFAVLNLGVSYKF